MRLLCQKFVLLIGVSTLACSDPSGPLASQHFVLHDVSGRPLPTYLAPTPGLTVTIVSGSLVFNGSNKAILAEHRINADGTASDFTDTYTYKITGTKIDLEPTSACLDLCAAPPRGTLTAFGIGVDFTPWQPGFIVYNYTAN